MITAYPKIFTIGTDYIRDIFTDAVEVTEKVDGSQFCFGKVQGELFLRSKGARLFTEAPEKMFTEAIAHIEHIQYRIPDNMTFYAEYLKKPKHNTLKYDRIPRNHLILFGAMHNSQKFDEDLDLYAEGFGIERVPTLYSGMINSAEELTAMLNTESILGGVNIEGVVVKNYSRPFLLGGRPLPLMAGKYVSEKFKEVHQGRWKSEETKKSRMDIFMEGHRTEARWAKAVQHLRDAGQLDNEPKDIGKLFKAVHMDIEAEEKDNIKEFLWTEFNKTIKRHSTSGLPEWYKQQLAERSFEQGEG